MPPFAVPEVYENPVILEFLKRYWNRGDFYIKCLHSKNPYPGTDYQHWDRDTPLPGEIPHVGLDTCLILGIKFPLVDTSEENGSVEVLPSTQYIASPDLQSRYDDVLTQADFPSARRLNMKMGSMWKQDPRMLHRGTPNTPTEPRPEIVVCYGLSWIDISHQMKVPTKTYDSLSARGRELFKFCQVVDY